METIQVRMLGEFSLQWGDARISDAGNRAKKLWSLLAYLISNREQMVPQQKLYDLLWGDDPDTVNPDNALRITMHRLRAQLDKLRPGAGRELIISRDGSYGWNPQFVITLDCEYFEVLCQSHREYEDQRLDVLLEALALYQGSFLPRHTGEMWVVGVNTHYQNLFLQASMEAAQLLLEKENHSKAVEVCRRAVSLEPYHEPLHQYLMQALAGVGDPKGAAAVYDALSKRLFDDFGIRPNEQTRAVYRAAAFSPADRTLPMDEVLEHLVEPEGKMGAMECDYDHFKVLCYAESRAIERSGTATHIALFSLSSGTDTALSKRSNQRIMEQLGTALRMNLRRGDTISRCSVSQYIVMLPKANYENSCLVCRRILTAFSHAYPHVRVKINFMVQPLIPGICVP